MTFRCERTAPVSLSAAERQRRLAGIVEDYLTIARFVLGNGAIAATHTKVALHDYAKSYTFPDLETLNTVVGWTINELQWTAKVRPLTPHEHLISEAAWRLSDALHGQRDTN